MDFKRKSGKKDNEMAIKGDDLAILFKDTSCTRSFMVEN